MNLTKEQRAAALKAVRESAGLLRAVPRPHLEARRMRSRERGLGVSWPGSPAGEVMQPGAAR
jgi:hypothetical protein